MRLLPSRPPDDVRAHIDTSVPAVVLKLDPNVFHHGGLGVIRSLGRLGVPVYGVHEDRFAPAARSRYLHGRAFWRPDPADVDRLSAGLLRLADRIGRPAVLVPTDDAGAVFLAEHGDALRSSYLFAAPPAALPRTVADKHGLHRTCRDLGLPYVDTVLTGRRDEADAFAGRHGFPLVVKVTRPWAPGNRADVRSTTVVRSRAELASLWTRSRACLERPLVLQQYIPGGRGPDWFFHGYCDGASRPLAAFTGVKERSYPPHAGLTSLGRVEPNPRLRTEVELLLVALGYRGIMDLDLRYDARHDTYTLLDFNPRVGAQFRLFEDANGVDVVRAAHLDLTGRTVPVGAPHPPRRFAVENYDPLAALGYLRRGEVDVRGFVRSLRGVDEWAWFARDDLAPFGLMCARLLWRSLERPLSRHRSPRAVTANAPELRPGPRSRSSRGGTSPPAPTGAHPALHRILGREA